MGQNTGKALVTYNNHSSAQDAIDKFDNFAIDNLVCSVKPFFEKGQKSQRKSPSLLARRVYLMNLPYDVYPKEVEKLCNEFVPVEKVVIGRDPSGIARGYAFVYLKNIKDVQTLIDYVDGRHIRSR